MRSGNSRARTAVARTELGPIWNLRSVDDVVLGQVLRLGDGGIRYSGHHRRPRYHFAGRGATRLLACFSRL